MNLGHLAIDNLSGLTGGIPANYTSLSRLSYFVLRGTGQLGGTLPPGWSSLTNLRVFGFGERASR